MQKIDDPTLDELVRRIVKTADPDRVILFGSRARGTARPSSDYDFLVVKRDIPVPLNAFRLGIYHALYGLGVAKDIVLTTPDVLERYGKLIGSVLKPAMEEGIEVYRRAA